ncbi:hypothetical protein KVT40_006905 [Elsinoe batatas]|uniref:Uncharacterized protein n=1 Tax=Elsinoe batatas TaxID=2601811 RepID=A0A8K0PH26_9PEZI|nr:hypothetical protein KVT40_006905 [Elsinoe batatas]
MQFGYICRRSPSALPVYLRHLSQASQGSSALRHFSKSRGLGVDEDLYRYTSGRWLWAEAEQLWKRQRWFNVAALMKKAVEVKDAQQCTLITKLAEGHHSRVLRLVLDNAQSVVVRIPYLSQPDASASIDSEVAVMSFARDVLGLPDGGPLQYVPCRSWRLAQISFNMMDGCRCFMETALSHVAIYSIAHLIRTFPLV